MSYNLNSLDDILNCYGKRKPKYFYSDKAFDLKGIDYTRYIKLWFSSINNYHMRDAYGTKSWYLLFYLMAKAQDGVYIQITVENISSEIKLKNNEIIDLLNKLNNNGLIKFQEDIVNKNTMLHIAIAYQNNNIIDYSNGYRALPVEYVLNILPILTPIEWAILTVLVVNYSYFQVINYINNDTGEIVYNYRENYYSFPKLDTIAELTGISEKTVRLNLKKMTENPYKIIQIQKGNPYSFIDEDGNARVKNEVNKYYIPLLDRTEYIYHHIYSIDENENNKSRQDNIKRIRKIGFENIAKSEEQKILTTKDFINYKYKSLMDDYENILRNCDSEAYKKIQKYVSRY